jgi:FdhD protein
MSGSPACSSGLSAAGGRPGFRTLDAYSLPAGAGSAARIECAVVEEDILSIEVEGVGSYVLMWTQTEPLGDPIGYTREDGMLADTECPEALALAAGFCFTDGLMSSIEDIDTLAFCPDAPGVVRVQLANPSRVAVSRRNVVVSSSCGFCGSREMMENLTREMPLVRDTLRVDRSQLGRLMATMHERQTLYGKTGGSHAAAVFGPDIEVFAVAEDLGRHNALDKVIGKCLLQRRDLASCGLLLTSRLSFEMVVKAARAGFQLVAAISAPTSLAIELASRTGITLCGFVRDDRATIFAHPNRIAGARVLSDGQPA